MIKILNFALKIKGVVGRVAHAKSSDPATPQKVGTCTSIQTQKLQKWVHKTTHQQCLPY